MSTPVLAIYAASTGLPLLLLRNSSLIGRFAAARAHSRLVARAPAASVGAGLYAPAAAAGGTLAFFEAVAAATRADTLVEEPEVLALEQRFHDNLGTSARVVAYAFLVPNVYLCAQLAWRNATPLVALLHIVLYPVIALALWALFGLSRSGFERAKARLLAEFDAVDELLAKPIPSSAASGEAVASEGRPYLTGCSWTAADATFAALAAPVLGISRSHGYGAWLPPLEALPVEAQCLASSLRARPSGRLALRMYKMHRRPGPAGGVPLAAAGGD
jgi:hypothetical protein